MTDHALVLDSAVKRYGAVAALDGASFALGGGELVGLLGPNGAGKTTAIRAIAGRVALDAGRVALFGRTLAQSDGRPELGVVPQEIPERFSVGGAAQKRWHVGEVCARRAGD
jgi:ABC-2 type transport system ATP-binding protein